MSFQLCSPLLIEDGLSKPIAINFDVFKIVVTISSNVSIKTSRILSYGSVQLISEKTL